MKTVTQLDQDILDITLKIDLEFPELSKYIEEMPMTFSKTDKEISPADLEEYYNSLAEMLNDYTKTHKPTNSEKMTLPPKTKSITLDYPPSEDIYKKAKEEKNINPEDISKKKTTNDEPGTANEKNFESNPSGNDLDVPGSELDDQQEDVGNEDEENNFYSLGGDNHDD